MFHADSPKQTASDRCDRRRFGMYGSRLYTGRSLVDLALSFAVNMLHMQLHRI